MDAEAAVRIISSKERIDRMVISNVTGTVNGCFVVSISHYLNSGLGNIGSITLANVNVNRSDHDAPIVSELSALLRQRNRIEELIEFNGGVFPAFNINVHAGNLILRNVVMRAPDDRPILRIGPDSDVQRMTVELSVDDPGVQAVPVVLDEGGRVGRLNLYLDWKGSSVDVGKKLIQTRGIDRGVTLGQYSTQVCGRRIE